METSLRSLDAHLNRDALLFAQTLNYERILGTRGRIQSSKEAGSKTFVRFHDYDDNGVLFKILTPERCGAETEEKLETIRLRPIVREELVNLLTEAGFVDIEVFAGISMELFEPTKSKDIVVLAKAPT